MEEPEKEFREREVTCSSSPRFHAVTVTTAFTGGWLKDTCRSSPSDVTFICGAVSNAAREKDGGKSLGDALIFVFDHALISLSLRLNGELLLVQADR